MVRSSRNPPHPVWWEFVEESLEEADFLWRRRERALVAPDFNLADVDRFVEKSLLGCIDGLRVGGDAAIDRVLIPALESGEAAQVSVAAYVLAHGSDTAWQRLLKALLAADEKLPALAHGIELVWPADVLPRLQQQTQGAAPAVQAAVVDVCAFRRRDPGPDASSLLASGDAGLQRSVLFAARFAPHAAGEPLVSAGLALPASPARDAAIESGLVCGFARARSACAESLRSHDERCRGLLVMGALIGAGNREHRDVLAALGNEALAPAAVWALGFAGTKEAADACVELMLKEKHARLACEAFCAITGVDLAAKGLLVAEPEEVDSPVPFEEDDLDADLTEDAGGGLPLADAAAVAKWWNENRNRFTPAVRYLQGRPTDRAVLLSALATAPMRRRHVLALDLAILTQGQQQANARAWCREQRAQLQGGSGPSPAPSRRA